MAEIVDAYWNELKDTLSYYQKNDQNLIFDETKYREFKDIFNNLYNDIRTKYMKSQVNALDRHKVVSIMLIATLKAKVIVYKKELKTKQTFLGAEMFATEVALTWMLDTLNKKLLSLGIKEKIQFYHMPEAFVCSTPYFDIFSRNLFFAARDYVLNPLDISEKLFLLEYITLIKNNIDPAILKE